MSTVLEPAQYSDCPEDLADKNLQLCSGQHVSRSITPKSKASMTDSTAENEKRDVVQILSPTEPKIFKHCLSEEVREDEELNEHVQALSLQHIRSPKKDLKDHSVSDTTNSPAGCVGRAETSSSSFEGSSLVASNPQDTVKSIPRRNIPSTIDSTPLVENASSSVITINVDSSNIERRDKKLYVGKMKELRPLPLLLDKWVQIRRRLVNDLAIVIQKLPAQLTSQETMFEPELYMAGYVASRRAKTVDLKPTVWLSCGSKQCKRSIRRAVDDLNYLKTFSEGLIEVRTDGPYLASMELDQVQEEVDITGPALSVGDGYFIHLHYERIPTGSSVCGLKLLVTIVRDGTIMCQRFSTIGGLIRVGDKVFGVTTAHTILSDYKTLLEPTNGEPESDDSELELYSESAYSSSDDECNIPNDNSLVLKPKQPRQKVQGLSDPPAPGIIWDRLPTTGRICYNNLASLNGTTGPSRWPKSTADFALLDLGLTKGCLLDNIYQPPGETKDVVVNVRVDDEALLEGPVSVLASKGHVIQGYLLPGLSMYMAREAVCHTRKIQLNQPLERGTSGAWVVRNNALCGIIVAVYNCSNYAHMMTADKLISDIKEMRPPTLYEDIMVNEALLQRSQNAIDQARRAKRANYLTYLAIVVYIPLTLIVATYGAIPPEIVGGLVIGLITTAMVCIPAILYITRRICQAEREKTPEIHGHSEGTRHV